MLLSVQANFVAYFEWQEDIVLKVRDKDLSHRSRQAVDVIYQTSQSTGVGGIDVRRRDEASIHVRATNKGWPGCLREGH